MKANELMIGDWLMYDDEPIKIESIYEYSHCYRINDDNIYAVGLKPIPLTEEILKVNGYRLIKDKESNYCGGIIKNEDLTIWVHLGDKYNYHTRIVNHKITVTQEVRLELAIRYVHELQHALRLCGLTELADNFKIE